MGSEALAANGVGWIEFRCVGASMRRKHGISETELLTPLIPELLN
jgi:hypothetical protein